MGKPETLASLVAHIDRIADEAAKQELIERLVRPERACVLGFVNAHAINLAWEHPAIAELFMTQDSVLRDGKGLEILDRWCERDPGLNMNGTDFIPELLSRVKGQPIALFGTTDPWLTTAGARLSAKGHTIVSTLDGFKTTEAYVAAAIATAPAVIVLAMGMPRQEEVALALRTVLGERRALIICGGAILDFLADRVPRAPDWMRMTGLEWAFRLLHEPRRLFRRYIIGNILFSLRARKISRMPASGRT